MTEPRVIRNDDAHRYELWLGDTMAGYSRFREEPGRAAFTHTVIEEAYEGQGLGSLLARAALDDVAARDEVIVPYCPFIAAYIRRHSDYDDRVEWPQPQDGAPSSAGLTQQ